MTDSASAVGHFPFVPRRQRNKSVVTLTSDHLTAQRGQPIAQIRRQRTTYITLPFRLVRIACRHCDAVHICRCFTRCVLTSDVKFAVCRRHRRTRRRSLILYAVCYANARPSCNVLGWLYLSVCGPQ